MTDKVEPLRVAGLPATLLRWAERIRVRVNSAPDFLEGAGTPEASVFARKGTRYYRTDGTAGTLLYVKSTDATLNTGWVAYA